MVSVVKNASEAKAPDLLFYGCGSVTNHSGEHCMAKAAAVLSLVLISSTARASEYCTKEQYQHDRALIENAVGAGTLVEDPKGLRDSILVQEVMWFGMNDPRQI